MTSNILKNKDKSAKADRKSRTKMGIKWHICDTFKLVAIKICAGLKFLEFLNFAAFSFLRCFDIDGTIRGSLIFAE